jgi:glutathionylspermidine synthase
MQRIGSTPRPGWQDAIREHALIYAEVDVPQALRLWDESAYYTLTMPEVRGLEAATEELHELCLAAARHVVTTARYAEFGIPDWAAATVRRSLASDAPSLFGCLDLWYDGTSPPKLLEYHADTPPALVEAAICQWYWLEQTRPTEDQWNQLHERLVTGWHAMAARLGDKTIHCGWSDVDPAGTDRVTVGYLAETARQAGLTVHPLPMRAIGWDGTRFVDEQGEPILTCFKLYPWAFMVREPYGPLALAETCQTTWLEPAWKLLLASPALYPLLWELNPGHPNLWPAAADRPREVPPLPTFDGHPAVVSSWVVSDAAGRGRAAGVGFRESTGPTMAGYARFVPHVVTR